MKKLFFLLAIAASFASCSVYETYPVEAEMIMRSSNDTLVEWEIVGTTNPDSLFEDVFPEIEYTGKQKQYLVSFNRWNGDKSYESFPIYMAKVKFASRKDVDTEAQILSYLEEQIKAWEGAEGAEDAIAALQQAMHGIAEGDYIPYEEWEK